MPDEPAEGFTPDGEGLGSVLDHVLDFHLDRQDAPAIRRRRWMPDAADPADVEDRHLVPIHQRALAIPGPGIVEKPGFQMIFSVFGWCPPGFATGGILRGDGPAPDPASPQARVLFRTYMTELFGGLL